MTTPRKTTYLMHSAVALVVDDTIYVSEEIDCMQESKFLLGYTIGKTGVLVDGDRLRIVIQFREAGGTWRDYTLGPFGQLYEEESTTPCNICISGDAVGEKLRLTVTSDYTNATPAENYFTVTTQLTLME